MRISWDEAWYLMERAVRRGVAAKQKSVIPTLGVDEKASAKGHKYLTLVCDLQRACVDYVGFDRKKESLDLYFQGLSQEQLDGIEAIAMDMWEPYIQSAREHVPGAEDKIVFDRYHIMGSMGKAVDTVRKREHRALRAAGDETLTGSKYLWLYSEENLRISPRLIKIASPSCACCT